MSEDPEDQQEAMEDMEGVDEPIEQNPDGSHDLA